MATSRVCALEHGEGWQDGEDRGELDAPRLRVEHGGGDTGQR